MNVSAHRAFSFLRTYGYERVSCSKEERTVAEALLNECTSLGVSAQLEEFTVPCGRVSHALLRVTSPYVKEYEVIGYPDGRPLSRCAKEFIRFLKQKIQPDEV